MEIANNGEVTNYWDESHADNPNRTLLPNDMLASSLGDTSSVQILKDAASTSNPTSTHSCGCLDTQMKNHREIILLLEKMHKEQLAAIDSKLSNYPISTSSKRQKRDLSPVGAWAEQPTPRSIRRFRGLDKPGPIPGTSVQFLPDPAPQVDARLPAPGSPSLSTDKAVKSQTLAEQLADIRREKHVEHQRLASKPSLWSSPKQRGPTDWSSVVRGQVAAAAPRQTSVYSGDGKDLFGPSVGVDAQSSAHQHRVSSSTKPNLASTPIVQSGWGNSDAGANRPYSGSGDDLFSPALTSRAHPLTQSKRKPKTDTQTLQQISPGFVLPAHQIKKNKKQSRVNFQLGSAPHVPTEQSEQIQHRTDRDRQRDMVTGLVQVLSHDGHDRGVAITESHYKGVQGIDIRAKFDVVAVGGLCIVAAADGLEASNRVYANYSQVFFDVWSNNYNHHRDESGSLCESVFDGTKRFLVAAHRMFPNAELITVPPFMSNKLRICGGSPQAVIRMIERASTFTGVPVSIHGNVDTRDLKRHDWYDQVHLKRRVSIPLMVNVIRASLGLPLQRQIKQISANTLRGSGPSNANFRNHGSSHRPF